MIDSAITTVPNTADVIRMLLTMLDSVRNAELTVAPTMPAMMMAGTSVSAAGSRERLMRWARVGAVSDADACTEPESFVVRTAAEAGLFSVERLMAASPCRRSGEKQF